MNLYSGKYTRFLIITFALLATLLVNTNNNLLLAQYEKKAVFKKMSNPYKEFDPAKQIMYLYLDDIDDGFDPATCSNPKSLEIIGGTYEPPLTYHYLKRPLEIVPLTAREIPKPVYYREVKLSDEETKYVQCNYDEIIQAMNSKQNAEGDVVFPKDEESEVDTTLLTGKVKVSYKIQITPGIYFAPHPCFAKDEKGYLYHTGNGNGRSIDEKFGNSISSLEDFPFFGTRELIASDYVYGIRRLFNPKIGSPVFSKFLSKYVKDAMKFRKTILKAFGDSEDDDNDDDDDWEDDWDDEPWDEEYYGGYYGGASQILPYLDYDFDGIRLIDKYTFEINLNTPFSNFLHYLTQYYFSPIPWEADVMYNELADTDYKTFSFDIHPVGTGPYTVRYYSNYYYWGMDRYKGNHPVHNANSFIISNKNPYFNRLTNDIGQSPPLFNSDTGYGVDKNKNGKLDGDELAYFDLNQNGKYDGLINGEGYYFEDLNNNGEKDSNELWYELPASYRNVYPDDGDPNASNADLSKLLSIRASQREYLIEDKISEYSSLHEDAVIEINNFTKSGVDISKIGDVAKGNLLDAGRRLPLISTIFRSNFESKAQMMAYLANGFLDSVDPEMNENVNIISKYGAEVSLVEEWDKRGLYLESNSDLSIAYWGINMRDKKIGWNERDSDRASDSLRKIRQAIAIVFDVEEWIRKFCPDRSVSPTFAPKCVFDESDYKLQKPNLWIYEQDRNNGYKRRSIEVAKSLLKEAGWENGKNKDGVQLTLQIDKYDFYFGEDERDWLRRIFTQVGIAIVILDDVDQSDYFDGTVQLFYTRWHTSIPDISEFAYIFYGSNHDFYYGHSFGRVNKANYMNVEYDHLYKQLNTTIDENERKKIVSTLNKIINFDVPSMGFIKSKRYSTYYPWLQNYKYSNVQCRQNIYQRIDTSLRTKMQAEIMKLYE